MALLVLTGAFANTDFEELASRYAAAETSQGRQRVAQQVLAVKGLDQPLQALAEDVANGKAAREPELGEALAARAELMPVDRTGDFTTASEQARSIKRNPLFADAGAQDRANWIQRAFDRLRNLRIRRPEAPGINAPSMPNVTNLDRWLIGIMWVLLGLLVVGLLVFAFRHFSWKRTLRRKAMALLDEDEPERTVDEWLVQADALAGQGRHREAVRCLYLACLLRFDEQGVARFDRGETNWEHLRRIQASPKRPANPDFAEATRHFDVVWYGGQVRGAEDVDRMRSVYDSVTRLGVKAA